MDYSLLLTITTNDKFYAMKNRTSAPLNAEDRVLLKKQFDETKSNRHTFLSLNCKYIYHLGIIDYLQDYHFEKKMENFAKETVLGRSSVAHGEISAVQPARYAPRFVEFM